MDLPSHGDSPACDGSVTMRAIAESVYTTLQNQHLAIDAILGHSYGGKVTMEYLRFFNEGRSSLPSRAIILDISALHSQVYS